MKKNAYGVENSVHNIKRRMASQPPISFQEYETTTSTLPVREDNHFDRSATPNTDVPTDVTQTDKAESEDDVDIPLPSPASCLFCTVTCDTIEQNLSHMKAVHDFTVPNVDKLQTDLETFISYLALVVSRYFSCLYCGYTRHSVGAIRSHMLDKRHCMLDLSPESEFLEFWETVDPKRLAGMQSAEESLLVRAKILSDTEIRLPSGAIASSRHVRPQTFKDTTSSSNQTSLVPAERSSVEDPDQEQSSTLPKSQAITRRDQMGVLGLSDHQRRSLMAVEQKIRARELKHNDENRWASEKFANQQKYYMVSTTVIAPDRSLKLTLDVARQAGQGWVERRVVSIYCAFQFVESADVEDVQATPLAFHGWYYSAIRAQDFHLTRTHPSSVYQRNNFPTPHYWVPPSTPSLARIPRP